MGRSNGMLNFRSDRPNREKWSTSKGRPAFSKLFWLDRTDPFSFRPRFLEVLVERIVPLILKSLKLFTFVVRKLLTKTKQSFGLFLLKLVGGIKIKKENKKSKQTLVNQNSNQIMKTLAEYEIE